MKNGWTNPNPITPPPPVPGTKKAQDYYNDIKNYTMSPINMTQYPPQENESVSQYRNRLVQTINGKD